MKSKEEIIQEIEKYKDDIIELKKSVCSYSEKNKFKNII